MPTLTIARIKEPTLRNILQDADLLQPTQESEDVRLVSSHCSRRPPDNQEHPVGMETCPQNTEDAEFLPVRNFGSKKYNYFDRL